MLLPGCATCIFLFCLFSLIPLISATHNLTLPHQHPYPEVVAQEVQRRVNESISRRLLLPTISKDQCLTGNPIDDCWQCDPNWGNNRQRLADCAIGFGQAAMGGKGGMIYVVSDSSDADAVNPKPGTLRHAVIQTEPLWIIFAADMTIKLKHELIVNSYKTIDGRGANVQVTGNGCITLQYVSNVIIHNIHVYNCLPSGNTIVRSSPTHAGWRGRSDGDGISLYGARNIWIDHCALSHCTDGLIDAIMGSTAITISNSYFSHHDEVMLLGHEDGYMPDSGMQVTKRVDTNEGEWSDWNWRTEGDMMINGAYFVPSGNGLSNEYAKASSLDPQSAVLIDQLTMHAGVFGGPRGDNSIPISYGGGTTTGATSNSHARPTGGDSADDPFGMIFGNAAAPPSSPPPIATTIFFLSLLIIPNLYLNIATNQGG
nr:probable pectate lyase 5 isoform X1 [Ipomoea batatas]